MKGFSPMEINGNKCWYAELPTPKTVLLLVRGEKGLLGCGYLNMKAAVSIGEALAIVRGVQSIEEMLDAQVVSVSPAAASLGVSPGMTGREAMRILA